MASPKNTICLWFERTRMRRRASYAVTFPDSKVPYALIPHELKCVFSIPLTFASVRA